MTSLKNETTLFPLDATPNHFDSHLPSMINQIDDPEATNISYQIYDSNTSNCVNLVVPPPSRMEEEAKGLSALASMRAAKKNFDNV